MIFGDWAPNGVSTVARFLGVIFVLGWVGLQMGCATQARQTYKTFGDSDDYLTLYDSMRLTQDAGRDSTIREQSAAVRELRYMTKYEKERGKREMALRSLAFVAYFSDNGVVRDRAVSRLDLVVESFQYDDYLKLAVVHGLRDIVIGRTGYTKTSFLGLGDESEFSAADTDDREEALDDLIDWFPALPPYIQYRTVGAFKRILHNPAEGDKGVEADQKDWKAGLLDVIPDWLDDDEISPLIKRALVEMVRDRPDILAKWTADGKLPQPVLAMIEAVTERRRLYLGLGETEAVPESLRIVGDLVGQPPDVLATHLAAALNQQVFTPEIEDSEEGDDTVQPMQVPAELVFREFPETDAGRDEQEVVYEIVIRSLNLGMILDGENLAAKLTGLIQRSGTPWKLEKALELMVATLPSVVLREEDALELLDVLVQGVRTAPDETRSRLYLRALVRSRPYYMDAVNARLLALNPDLNVLARQRVVEWRASLRNPVLPVNQADFAESKRKWGRSPLEPPPGPEPHPSTYLTQRDGSIEQPEEIEIPEELGENDGQNN